MGASVWRERAWRCLALWAQAPASLRSPLSYRGRFWAHGDKVQGAEEWLGECAKLRTLEWWTKA